MLGFAKRGYARPGKARQCKDAVDPHRTQADH